jgi:hypothetical protein
MTIRSHLANIGTSFVTVLRIVGWIMIAVALGAFAVLRTPHGAIGTAIVAAAWMLAR